MPFGKLGAEKNFYFMEDKNVITSKIIKKIITGLILFAFFTSCWLYILSFIRGRDIEYVFTDYGNWKDRIESSIYKAIFIAGEIFLIFLSKKMIAKVTKFIKFIKELK